MVHRYNDKTQRARRVPGGHGEKLPAKEAKDFAKSAKKTVDLNIKDQNPKRQRAQRWRGGHGEKPLPAKDAKDSQRTQGKGRFEHQD
jgi:hypothetical protein